MKTQIGKTTSTMPARYKECTFDDVVGQNKEVIAKVKEYCKLDTPDWLIISCKKFDVKATMAAVACMEIENNMHVFGNWVNMAEFSLGLRDLLNTHGGSISGYISKYYKQDLLVMDDLGVMHNEDNVLEGTYTLLNHRFENCKRTIVTTELSLEEFAIRYGGRYLAGDACCVELERRNYWAEFTRQGKGAGRDE